MKKQQHPHPFPQPNQTKRKEEDVDRNPYAVEVSSGYGSSAGVWPVQTFPDLSAARAHVWERLRVETVLCNCIYHHFRQRLPLFEEDCYHAHFEQEWIRASIKHRRTEEVVERYAIEEGWKHTPNIVELVRTFSELKEL
ncbi:hypothetical protein QOT17_023326 [Balamuthia mandrillaris]